MDIFIVCAFAILLTCQFFTFKLGAKIMAAIDDIEQATTDLGTALEGIAADIEALKQNPDPARIQAAADKLKTLAAAAKALDESNPSLPPGTV